jgi:hypothetical protein
MSAVALSPEGALRWLTSLSIDVRAAAVLDGGGTVLAGDAELGARAARALAAAPAGAGAAEVRDGDLLAVRAGGHTVAAALGPHALVRLARCDLGAAARALEGT